MNYNYTDGKKNRQGVDLQKLQIKMSSEWLEM